MSIVGTFLSNIVHIALRVFVTPQKATQSRGFECLATHWGKCHKYSLVNWAIIASNNGLSTVRHTCFPVIDYDCWPVYPDTPHKHLNSAITKDILISISSRIWYQISSTSQYVEPLIESDVDETAFLAMSTPQTVMLGGIPPSIHYGGTRNMTIHGMQVSCLKPTFHCFNLV